MTRSVLKRLHFGKRLQHPIRELPKEQINLLAILVKNVPFVKGKKNQLFDVQLLVLPILNLTVLQQPNNFNP